MLNKFMIIIFVLFNSSVLNAGENNIIKGHINDEVKVNSRVVKADRGPYFQDSYFDKLKLKEKGFYTAQYRVLFYAAELNLVVFVELIGLFEEADRKVINSYSLPLLHNFYYENIKIKEWKSFNEFSLIHDDGHIINIKMLGDDNFKVEYNLKK